MVSDWPGNIRELENFIKQFVVLEDEASIWENISESEEEKLERTAPAKNTSQVASPAIKNQPGLPVPGKSSPYPSLKVVGKKAARKAEEELIQVVLHQTRWNRKKAARLLEISYKALLYKIKDYGLEVNDTPGPPL